MPNWHEISNSLSVDVLRKKYVKELSDYTERPTIIYYSGFLHQPAGDFSINERDKLGFMSVIHELECENGLDLILHTPGGDIAATESLIRYLYSKFGKEIRVIVPQLAMSAGTLIACSAKSIVMGKHSSLGPIDPQLGRFSASEVIAEVNRIYKDIEEDPNRIIFWNQILSQYQPGFIDQCEKAISWSKELAEEWLSNNMFDGEEHSIKKEKIEKIVQKLLDTSVNYVHNRQISIETAQKIGLNIEPLESDQTLQDLVLSVHHAAILTFSLSSVIKIIENQNGVSFLSVHN